MNSHNNNTRISDKQPNNIYELINETYNDYNEFKGTKTYSNCLINIIKKYHYYPSMQVKKFKNNDNLVLLHNNYKSDDIDSYKELYEQCRSIVLDFSNNTNPIISYANIPERISINEYLEEDNDIYQEAYDGTMITVYYYNNKWFFGTTSCTDVNYSYFSHPTKKHGMMLDEIIIKKFNISKEDLETKYTKSNELRELLTNKLDINISYEFVLIHSDNKHIIDYTPVLGVDYKELVHINSKNRITLNKEDINTQPLKDIGIIYPVIFNDINSAINHITNNLNLSYGFIIKKNNKLYKISTDYINIKEETDSCNYNVWYNLLNVYMKNNKNYLINDYIKDYNPNINIIYDNNGKEINPTYLIHTSICSIRDVLYNMYIATTTYNTKKNIFKMNKELDSQFSPIIRFHLGQLRYKQTTVYNKHTISPVNVYHYLCNINIKNIKLIMTILTSNIGYNINDRAVLCLTILNSLLS